MLPVNLEKEELYKGLCVRQALQHRIHKASIAQVLHASETEPTFLGLVIQKSRQSLLHQ